jgi:dolichyl-phosphate-mannose-protein mannosyltransferase
MLKKLFKNPKQILILILILSAFLRLYNLWYPETYVFDEVYHAFTAKQYLQNDPKAWEWWNSPPPGVAYEWTHPPLAKAMMAFSMGVLHTTDAWAYRLPGALLGILSVYIVYLLGKKIFDSEKVALISAFAFSLDGLNFVQSRTGMNDIYFVTFMLICILLLLNKRLLWSAIFLGLALSSKWTGFYLFGMVMVLALLSRIGIKQLLYFYLIPPAIYLITYLPFFLYDHQNYSVFHNNWELFVQLQQQMWWYHTGLKATHDYSSPWWTWPFNLKPVWYYVDYKNQNGEVSNIFASGNPLMFLFGFVAVLGSAIEFLQVAFKKLKSKFSWSNLVTLSKEPAFIPLLGYFIFWLPWALSPRIMFLYHYSPSIPFMALLLGYQIVKVAGEMDGEKILALKFSRTQIMVVSLFLIAISFAFVYPMLIGTPLDRQTMLLFFHSNLTKNPFGS